MPKSSMPKAPKPKKVDKDVPMDAVNLDSVTVPVPSDSEVAPKRPMTRDEIVDKMTKAGQPIPPKYAGGGSVSSASRRGDGAAQRGRTKGRFV